MEEVHDLDEAKLVIDMKNDQINSLQNALKMVEIKANKNIAQANYKVTTEKNRCEQLRKQAERTKDELSKLKEVHLQSTSTLHQLQSRLEAVAKEHQQKLRHERDQAKLLSVQIRDYEINMQELKEEMQSLRKQSKNLKRVINTAKILEMTGKSSLEDVPPYTDLMSLLREKADQVNELREKLQAVTAEALGVVCEKEQTLNSIEQQLQREREEKQKLESELMEKSTAILAKQEQLELHRQLLDEAKHKHEATFEQLTAELTNLRTSVNIQKKESFNPDDSLKIMHEMAAQFEAKEEQYQRNIDQLERELVEAKQDKKQVERQLVEENKILRRQIEELQAVIHNISSERKSNEAMIETLRNQTTSFQSHFERMKTEVDRWKRQAEDTLKAKNQLRDRLNSINQEYRSRQSDLQKEIEGLRQQQKQLNEDFEERKYSRLSLDVGRKQEVDFEDLYKTDLMNHNRFLQEIYGLLSK